MLPLPGFDDAARTLEAARELSGVEQRVGSLVLRNRVVMAAMTTGFASTSGRPTTRLAAWYATRGAGGAGAVIVEETLVLDDARCRVAYPRRLRLSDDARIPAFRRLAAAIRAGGARAVLQLSYPAVGDVSALPVADLARLAEAFAAAARRAQRADFDAIELQCLPSRVLGQVISPLHNRRRDRYGRGPQGRLRLVRDTIAAIRRVCGGEFPILVKFSADERNPRGVTPYRAQDIARALEEAGAAAFEVAGGATSNPPTELLSTGVGEATRADLAATVKAVVAASVLANGRIVTGDGLERVLREGHADLASVGRALLADPAWYAKQRAGIEIETVPCISCMACFTPAPDGGTGCPVNGDAGREYLPPLVPAPAARRIAILGASLPALELARVAASRGHTVELTTAGLPLGGLLGLRAGVPGNAEFGRALLYYGDRLRELGVYTVDDPTLGADVVVDCRPGPEMVPAWTKARGVLLAGDILGRDLHEMYGIGRRVVVAGPGALAAEVALFLAGWGRRPTVVVPAPAGAPFPDVHPTHAARLRERLDGYNVTLVAGAVPLAWHYDDERRCRLRVTRGDGEETLEPFHSAVSAAGWQPAAPWPQRARVPRRPRPVPDGAMVKLGDTIYPEPLRDLVAYANLLGRIM